VSPTRTARRSSNSPLWVAAAGLEACFVMLESTHSNFYAHMELYLTNLSAHRVHSLLSYTWQLENF